MEYLYIGVAMSRAFHPPDSLDKKDIKAIADVRRDIWKGGFYGILYGSMAGLSLHTVSKYVLSKYRKKSSSHILTRNTSFLSFMLGGALGSFIMATTTGKNSVHNLHDIFEVGKSEKPLTPYQQAYDRAQQDAYSIDNRVERRLTRRRTLKRRMEKDHGLSDSHGGQWVK